MYIKLIRQDAILGWEVDQINYYAFGEKVDSAVDYMQNVIGIDGVAEQIGDKTVYNLTDSEYEAVKNEIELANLRNRKLEILAETAGLYTTIQLLTRGNSPAEHLFLIDQYHAKYGYGA